MIRFALMLVLCMAVMAAFSYMPLLGEDKIGAKSTNGNVMEDWKKLQEPGMEHNVLAKRAGTWLVTATCWMDGADKPKTLAGTSEQSLVYDRYLREEFTLGSGATLMKGTGYIAFDNSSKKYEALYLGNMGTSLNVLSGEYDTKTSTFTFNSERTEKGLRDLKVKSRVVMSGTFEDKYVVNIYQTIGDQPEARCMELLYTRK